MGTEDIEAAFQNIRAALKAEGPPNAAQQGLVAAFEMLCIDMRRTADLLEEARGKPMPVRKTPMPKAEL